MRNWNAGTQTSTLICHNCDHKDEYIEELEAEAEELKAVNMERSAEDCGGWIPCKERLPTLTGKYIVCKKDSIFSFIAEFVQGQGANYWCGEFVKNMKDIDYWMSLPDPYREP